MNAHQTRRQGTFRFWAVHLLVCCFALRALIPAGFMPDFSAAAEGKLRVVICSAQGSKTLTIALGDAGSHQPATHHGQEICPFAAAPLAGYQAADLPLLTSLAFVSVPSTLPHDDQVVVRRVGPPLGSRGPPV